MILLFKQNSAEQEFCEACTLTKQHKVNSKEPPNDTTSDLKIS